MNDIPLVKDNGINAINTSLIAAKKSLQLVYSALDNVNKTFKDINKEIDAIDAKFADYLLKDDVVNSITDGDMRPVTSNAVAQIAPVDTVAFGNLHSVTSNAVFNTLSNVPVPVYWQDANHNDPLAEAEAIATNLYTYPLSYSRFSSFRLGNVQSVNTPYGNGDTDFYYQLYKIEDSNYISMLAFDIRSDRILTISRVNGVWLGWQEIQKIEYALADAPIVDTPVLSEDAFSNVRIRNGVYHLCGRIITPTPIAVTDGMTIGRLRQDYSINPTWSFYTNVHNFPTNEDYVLLINNNGDIYLFGCGNRTIALDFYIDTTYVK